MIRMDVWAIIGLLAHGGTHKGVSSRGINPCAKVNIYIGRARGEDTDPTYIYLLQIIFTQVRCDLVFLEVDWWLTGWLDFATFVHICEG